MADGEPRDDTLLFAEGHRQTHELEASVELVPGPDRQLQDDSGSDPTGGGGDCLRQRLRFVDLVRTELRERKRGSLELCLDCRRSACDRVSRDELRGGIDDTNDRDLSARSSSNSRGEHTERAAQRRLARGRRARLGKRS